MTATNAGDFAADLRSLLHPDSGIASPSIALGHDASSFDLDGPLPEIPESNASRAAGSDHRTRPARQFDGPPAGPDRRELWRPSPWAALRKSGGSPDCSGAPPPLVRPRQRTSSQ